jgi:Zn-dependent protease
MKQTQLPDNPVKEYRIFDIFRPDSLFKPNHPEAKLFNQHREDIDLPSGIPGKDFNPEEYSNRIIREYSPWENHQKIEYLSIGPPGTHQETEIIGAPALKQMSKKPRQNSNKGIIGGIVALVIAALLKFKFLTAIIISKIGLLLELLAPILQLKGLMLTAGSMIVTIFAYALIFKIQLAVGLVFLIFIHEMGHALMIALRGINAGLPVFIPFFGAFIALKEMPEDVVTEAQVALGGPLLGSLAAMTAFFLYHFLGDPFWLFLAYIGFIMNLFNLTPVSPLDGGRIVAAISTKIWIPGLLLLIAFTIILKTPALIIILFFAIMNLLGSIGKNDPPRKKYYQVPLLLRISFALCYFGLAMFLGYATYYTHGLLDHTLMYYK